MAKRRNNAKATETSAATVGYEAQLWQMADSLRGSMDAAEYKHVVLGLIFLKYISDARASLELQAAGALRRAWHTSATFSAPPLENWCEVACRDFRHGVRPNA